MESIIGDGISLASLQELMPVSVSSGKPVPKEYFKFELSSLTGNGTRAYPDYSALENNPDGYKVGVWPGNASGNISATMFPAVERMTFDALLLNGTIIESIGIVTVTVQKGDGSQTAKDYVYFSPTGSGVSADAMVLPDDVSNTHLFEVRYVYATYDITYQVYLDGSDISANWLDRVFGVRRTATTKDGMAFVDVSIPAGFTGRVYVGDTNGFTTDHEVFPADMPGYGEYPLGQELVYKQGEAGAEIDSGNGPGLYSTTGTYSIGSSDKRVSANQTVRVVLHEKTQYAFNPEYWMNSDYTGNGKYFSDDGLKKEQLFGRDKSSGADGFYIIPRSNGAYDLIWKFTTTLEGNAAGWLLESLEVNGVGLRIPYMDYDGVWQDRTENTDLPSGGSMYVTVKRGEQAYTCEYYLTVTGATQGVAITGGSLRAAGGESKLVLEDSTGTDVEFFFCGPKGENGRWVSAMQSRSVSASMMGSEFHYDAGDPGHNYTNVRFKLKSGYEWRYGRAGVANVVFCDQKGTNLPWGLKSESKIYSGEDEWCYLRLGTGEDYYSRDLGNRRLSITAKPARYVIQYLDGNGAAINAGVSFGEGGIENMPGFADGDLIQGNWPHKNTNTLDGNHGNYYGIAARIGSYFDSRISNTATIHGSAPQDTAAIRPAQFQGWVVTDANGNALDEHGEETTDEEQFLTCQPGGALSISEVMARGVLFDQVERLYVIYLTGEWKARAPSYTYYVTFNEKTRDGAEKTRIQIDGLGGHFDEGDVEAGKKAHENYSTDEWYAFRRDSFFNLEGAQKLSGLNIAFDAENEQAKGLMEGRFKWYKYDDKKNSAEHPNQFLWSTVPNGGEVDVWLISNLGELSIAKTVNSKKQEELDKAFPFTVTFTLPLDDTGTAGNENTFFGDGATFKAVYTISGIEGEQTLELESLGENRYKGTFALKNDQTASFILPGGTAYSITEDVDEGLYSIENSGENGVIQAASAASTAKFRNTPSGIVANITQVETAGADGMKEISTPAEIITIGSGDYVKYSIHVTNRDEERSVTVTVTDEIPNAKDDDGTRKKLSVNEASVSGTGHYTPDSDTAGTVKWENITIAPGETKTFSFTVTAPVVYYLNTYISTADVAYSYSDGPIEHLTTNAASLVVMKDWFRIGKVLPRSSRGEAGDRNFVFHITLSGSTETVSYPYIGLAAESYEDQEIAVPENGTLNFTNGTAEVRLKEGQAIAIYGIPENTGYNVEEEHVDGFRTSVVKQSTEKETAGSGTSGVITADTSDWLIFKNVPVGVRLSKSQRVVRTGDSGELVTVTPGDRVEYNITVKNIDQEMSARGVTVKDAVPAGLTVNEITAGGTRTDNSIVWNIPELGPSEELTVSFTASVPGSAVGESFFNMASAVMAGADEAFSDLVTATLQRGSLAIAKSVEGGPEPNEDVFSFTVDLAHSSDGTPLTGSYPYTSDSAGISGTVANGDTITLKKGETVTIKELPIDTRWTVTETGPFAQDDHGYEGQAPKSGTLTAQEPDGYVAFSNTWYGLYSLSYDGNGNTAGAPPIDGSRYREYETATLRQPASDFKRENAVFLGWSKKKNDTPLTSREAEDDAQIIEEVEFQNGDVTVFAVWGADVDGDGIADYKESVGPDSTPETDSTPEPDSTPKPVVSSEPYFSPQPSTENDAGGGTDSGSAPETGDSTRVVFWHAVFAGSVMGLAALWALLRHRKSE